MALITLADVTLAYDTPLLAGVSLQIEPGERLCLLGRNGAGKSTLLGILAGQVRPDRGVVVRQPHIRVALLAQQVPEGLAGSVRQVASAHAPPAGEVAPRPQAAPQPQAAPVGGPPITDIVLSRMQLDPEAEFATLSVGLKRRALLARALAADPDLLLLDEPTNHLDIDAIAWLESFLLQRRGSLLFVTHDRTLTHHLATRILEVDRGRLSSWACDYATYLRRREAQLAAEAAQQQQFDERLQQEEIWIRKGIQARRTRNEGRVRALERLREERRQRREGAGEARIEAQLAQATSRRVIEAKDLTFAYGNRPIVAGFSTTVMRGDKVSLVGANGAGKTTLLRLLLGQLQPQGGTVRHGARLQVAYFDQLRETLDESLTAFDCVADGNDRVTVNGKTRHVFGYLEDFLFTRDQARNRVGVLSGGERNRLLLAKLFTRPANVLALDEPTNDLDAETLEVLEAMLVDYPGTVLFVSHDRTFLDNVATSTIALEGDGRAKEYVGGYSDWLRQRPAPPAEASSRPPPGASAERPARPRPRKLSFNEKAELAALPGRIEALEAEVGLLHATLSDPAVYRNGGRIPALAERLEAAQVELRDAYARWEALDAIA